MSLKAEVLAAVEQFRQRGKHEFTLGEFWDAFGANLHGKKPSVSNALSTLAKQPCAPIALKSHAGGYIIHGVAEMKKASSASAASSPKASAQKPAKSPKRASAGKAKVAKVRKSASKKTVSSKRPRSAEANKVAAQKRKRSFKSTSFKSYLLKVLKQVHPDEGISKMSMEAMDNFTHDMMDQLVSEAASLAKKEGRKTITVRDIQSAVRIVLPGELAAHAFSEGVKAVARFNSAA